MSEAAPPADLPAEFCELLPPSASVTPSGHLAIGGCDLVELASSHGTPLYVYDEAWLRERAREYRDTFAALDCETRVVYASKAFPAIAMAEIVEAAGLWIDVSTVGELEIALRGGVPPAHIIFHGNNKSDAELVAAIRVGVGTVVLDSREEIGRLAASRNDMSATGRQRVYLRLTPGVEADTHTAIRTGQEDTKFGLGLADGEAMRAVQECREVPELDLVGVHCHIGSQIFELATFEAATEAVVSFCAEASDAYGEQLRELDLGGGFGIAYRAGETPIPIADLAASLGEKVMAGARNHGIDDPVLLIEPGRSIVGRAGLSVHEIGTVKVLRDVRTYVAVDGGMSDNLRPALYGAAYETLLANRPTAARTETVHVAGKHCESGDIVVADARLPSEICRGEFLVTPVTGAYGWAMANNYNMVTRPAVIFVEEGISRVVVRRETVDDILRLQVP